MTQTEAFPVERLAAEILDRWLTENEIYDLTDKATYALAKQRMTVAVNAALVTASAETNTDEPCECCESPAALVVDEIFTERHRQISAEGWTPEHDDQYRRKELSRAAASYIKASQRNLAWRQTALQLWPWSPKWFKPTTPRRELVKAAALIVAEIERLDRANLPTSENETSRRLSEKPQQNDGF